MKKETYGIITIFLVLSLFFLGCTETKNQLEITQTTDTEIPKSPEKEQPNIREILKSKIDSFGGTGMPKVTSILYQNNELYIEYTTWDINGGQASVFDEMQKLVDIITQTFENLEKPTKVTMRALPADSGVKETYTTTLAWEQLGKMANLELSYISWQDLTVYNH